jgi:methylated-DNA-[protein]-cysteine S-methyltransferase
MAEQFLADRIKTPIGDLDIVADEDGRLRAVEWTDHSNRMHHSLRLQYGKDGYALKNARNPADLSTALRAYFDGDLAAIDRLGRDQRDRVQKSVWKRRHRLRQTITYAMLAQRVGRPTAVRAVGHANGTIRSAWWCRATASSEPTDRSPVMAVA